MKPATVAEHAFMLNDQTTAEDEDFVIDPAFTIRLNRDAIEIYKYTNIMNRK